VIKVVESKFIFIVIVFASCLLCIILSQYFPSIVSIQFIWTGSFAIAVMEEEGMIVSHTNMLLLDRKSKDIENTFARKQLKKNLKNVCFFLGNFSSIYFLLFLVNF